MKQTKMTDIPALVHGKDVMYCPEFCGIRWRGKGKRRARRIAPKYTLHYKRRHLNGAE
jgi:hypothetical protein